VHSLAQRVLSHIRRQELLRAGDSVGVAVSGGIDSIGLLRLLLELRGELGIVLSVVHFNHRLRGAESDADEKFVADLAREHGLQCHVDSVDVAQHASQEHVSVEAAARELRYGFFRQLLGEDPSGAEARLPEKNANRGAGSTAPPKSHLNLGHLNLGKIATGHTLDDQAETVLMRVIRGAGTRGMGGIYPRIAVEDDDGALYGEIVRPLLTTRRRELEQYLKDIGQAWREDSSNADNSFTRNRVRKLLVPLLEKEFNPAVAENLAELAEIARDEEDFWENEVAGWMGTGVHWSEPEWTKAPSNPALIQIASIHSASSEVPTSGAKSAPEAGHPKPAPDDDELQARIDAAPWLVANASVDRVWFLGEPVAAQRRVIKAIGEHAGIPLEFKHVEEIRRRAEDDASGKELSLPHGWKVVREKSDLIFVTPDLRGGEKLQADSYEHEIACPGQTSVAEINSVFEVLRVSADDASRYNPDQLLDAASLAGQLLVRNWRPGDRFWPAHTKSPKKIKELLQERHVLSPTQRKLWPVVVSGGNDGEIVWMRGLATPAKFQPQPGHDVILIVEKTQEIQRSK
jgi:tRNA(Ile)-lysidine synthase